MEYVIIGNSTAAVGCIEGIRSVDREGDILLIAAEPHHTYGRPLISYLLEGKTDEERMKYRPDSFYADNGVETRLGVRAVRLDPAGKTVELEDAQRCRIRSCSLRRAPCRSCRRWTASKPSKSAFPL